ncbi:MAG: ATP phosphoribosyltransferase [Chloroflexi bacterium]|jgi:ATP phosphoribosyltransferase regulatory subunit|nr:MAG: ATP phosphoribosyltransferase [Chloroflexota bacterium]
MRPLRFALAQGLLLNDALTALRAIGLDVSGITPGGRRLVVAGGDIEFVLARPSDIATYVERGAADLAIVGKDVLLESGARVIELVELGFGACRFVVAAPRDAVERSLDEYRHLGTLDVATKYPNVAERHFRARGIAVEIVKVAGSAEVAPLVGLADWIVDLVATGTTLRANGLAVIEEIASSTARLVANPAAYHLRRPEIAPMAERLAAWAAAR